MARMNGYVISVVAALVLGQAGVLAGPPFTTDDPEPVGYHYWGFYIGSTQQFQKSEVDATLPHVEANIGGLVRMDRNNHLLFCIGPTVVGEQSISGYLGFQLTI